MDRAAALSYFRDIITENKIVRSGSTESGQALDAYRTLFPEAPQDFVQAIESIQKESHTSVDGVLGPDTAARILIRSGEIPPRHPSKDTLCQPGVPSIFEECGTDFAPPSTPMPSLQDRIRKR